MKYIRISQNKTNYPKFRFLNLNQIKIFNSEFNPLNNLISVEIELKNKEIIFFQIKGTKEDEKLIAKNYNDFILNSNNYFDLSF